MLGPHRVFFLFINLNTWYPSSLTSCPTFLEIRHYREHGRRVRPEISCWLWALINSDHPVLACADYLLFASPGQSLLSPFCFAPSTSFSTWTASMNFFALWPLIGLGQQEATAKIRIMEQSGWGFIPPIPSQQDPHKLVASFHQGPQLLSGSPLPSALKDTLS